MVLRGAVAAFGAFRDGAVTSDRAVAGGVWVVDKELGADGGTLGALPTALGIGEEGLSGVAALMVLAMGVFVAVLPNNSSSRSLRRPPPGCPAWACSCTVPFLITITVGISFSGVNDERKPAS
jgi:hypothetical protein